MSSNAALVLLSGGQDSTVCLAWALDRYDRVETVGFAYGQRHAIELVQRGKVLARLRDTFPEWAERLGEDHVVDLASFGALSDTALTREAEIEVGGSGLPTTFVPGRNLLFFIYAAAIGYRRGIRALVGGMCETDFAGYPDCRNDTIRALEKAMTLGMGTPIAIETPLMFIDKAETWALAHEFGGERLVDIIVDTTHSCYLGDRAKRHDWGYGCGTCPACSLRSQGWETWQARTEPIDLV